MGFSFSDITGGDVLGFAGGLLGNHAASEEARKQRDWEKAMSDTQMQRRVVDLKAAGLNPMLAVGHLGGASSGGGSTARQENPLASGVALRQQRQLNQAMINKASADSIKAAAETEESRSRTAINMERIAEVLANTDMLSSAAGLNRLKGDTTRSVTSLNEQMWNHRAVMNPINERYRQLQERIIALSMPMHRAESSAWSSWYGQNVRPYMRDAMGAGITAGQIKNLIPKARRK